MHRHGSMQSPPSLSVDRVLCATTTELHPIGVREADRHARAFDASLSVLSVMPPRSSVHAVSIRDKPSRSAAGGEREEESFQLDSLISWTAARTARAPGSFVAHVDRGDPATCIVERARGDGAGLVVVGTQDRHGLERLVLGSVAEAVVRRARCPVLVARAAGPSDGPLLAACDLAAGSPPVLLWAGALARRWSRSLTALHAIQLNMSDVALVATALFSGSVPVQPDRESAEAVTEAALGALGAELSAAGAEGTPDIESGPPAEVILARARSLGASLIVIGTHGRTGVARLLLGSVAERVVREAPCSVLVVR